MKKKLERELKAFMAMAIFWIGLFGIVLLCLYRFNRVINIWQLLGGLGIIITTLIVDVWYINKHWDGEEWV